MNNDTKTSSFILFWFGVFSMTQIQLIGSIGISEVVAYILAPFVFVVDYQKLRHDGFMPAIWLAFMVMLGCALSSWHNQTPMPLFWRGFAQVYSLFAYPVVFHKLLRNNLKGIKWMLLGICISRIINIFVFRQSVELSALSGGVEDSATAEMIMNGPLFWLQRLGGFLNLPVQGWYFQVPVIYAIIAPCVGSIIAIATSDSGRSAIAVALASAGIIAVGGKSIRRMTWISRHLVIVAVSSLCLMVALKTTYNYLASQNILNEKAVRKYEGQAKHGNSFLRLLMAGRAEVFVGLYACIDNPVWGFGPWALDEKGYYADFLSKYGNEDDYDDYMKTLTRYLKHGMRPMLPSHSHIIGFWMTYGILGLPYWLFVLFWIYRHLKRNMNAIPQWYGLIALWIPVYLWHLIFSPYGTRVVDCLFITTLLFCDAVRRKRIQLPYHMQMEALKNQ